MSQQRRDPRERELDKLNMGIRMITELTEHIHLMIKLNS